jgi:LPS export ABC transporter protein LptC
MKKIGLIMIIIILVIGTGVLMNNFFFAAPEEGGEEEKEVQNQPAQDSSRQPDTELEGANITLYSEDETTRWELGADSISQFSDSREVVLNQVRASVYKDGQQEITLTAEEGIVDMETGFLTLEGTIEIQGEDRKVKANKLNWNQAQNQLIGRGEVVITRSGLEVTGESFVAEVDLKKLRVKGNAEAIYKKAGDNHEG